MNSFFFILVLGDRVEVGHQVQLILFWRNSPSCFLEKYPTLFDLLLKNAHEHNATITTHLKLMISKFFLSEFIFWKMSSVAKERRW